MPTLFRSTTELVIHNETPQLAVLSEAMERIGSEYGLAHETLYQLQVALDESVSNVIKYAWPEGGIHEIRVGITVSSGQVAIEISDDGRTFDAANAPLPPSPLRGQRPAPGGVGIHMLKQIMDTIEYRRIDGHNCLTLTKLCNVGVPNP